MSSSADVSAIVEAMESKKKIRGIAKKFTLFVLAITFAIGIFGAAGWLGETFDMTAYVEFIKAFSFLFIPLILSIGANAVVSKSKDKDIEKAEKVAKISKGEN